MLYTSTAVRFAVMSMLYTAIAFPQSQPTQMIGPVKTSNDNTGSRTLIQRSTIVDLYGDGGCTNYLQTVNLLWEGSQRDSVFEHINSGTWQSVRFSGGDHAQFIALCQAGHSCFDDDIRTVIQTTNVCSSGGGMTFDKILISA
jgi:hypothetical protein